MKIQVVNIEAKFNKIHEYWDPKIVGALNGQHVKIARIKGEFDRHKHEAEDEMFLVIEGKLHMQLDDRSFDINPGEFIVIPKNTYHRPIAKEEVKIMLFEPESTLNTGNIISDKTKNHIESI